MSVFATRCTATRYGPPIYEILSRDQPKLSALALNEPFPTPVVRFNVVARQNDPSPKLTARKVINRPLHLA